MAQSFTLGIPSLWDELQTMQTHGLYWLTLDRTPDALSLCRQTILAQQAAAHVTLIDASLEPHPVLEADYPQGPASVPLYRLTPTPQALMALSEELDALVHSRSPRLILLLLPAPLLTAQSTDWLSRWLKRTHDWLQRHEVAWLVISHGTGSDTLRHRLITQSRVLYGLACLYWRQESGCYDIAFWCNALGVSARQAIPLTATPQGWQASIAEPQPQPHNDEHRYLAHHAVLEGAPPLSEHWQLFASNHDLFTAALTAQAATLIFSLMQNDQMDDLARQIHTLRRQRGSALKIAVREQTTMQRSSDERLLLACGANVVIPQRATLSNALMIVEGLQGQTFPHPVPANIDTLLRALQPLKQRGYLPCPLFCDLLDGVLENPLLPRDGRGTLVALQPVSGMTAQQMLVLCHLRRDGDLATLAGQQLVLFLAYCRPHELATALRFIFPLPVETLFASHQVWYQDGELTLTLARMRDQAPATAQQTWPSSPQLASAPTVAPPARQRRTPQPLILETPPAGATS